MELVKLNANNQATSLLESYDSLIWSERFNTIGDFQLVTGNVEEYMEMLPEGTVVTLRDTTVPMIVETHQIDRKKRAGAKLTIKGREYTSILDRRVSIKEVVPNLAEWLVVAKIPSDIAHYIIHQICVLGVADPADIFPPEKVQFITPSDYLASSGPNRQFSVAKGSLLQTVVNLIQTQAAADPSSVPVTPAVVPHGIRAIRPDASGTAIAIEIYSGTDRSGTVFFEGTRDLLDDGSYLFSKVGSANVNYAIAPTLASKMSKTEAPPSGLDRRVIFTEMDTENVEALRAKQSSELSQANETAIFDGSINQELSPYVYGVDYQLGDVVRLVGDYGLSTPARVTEYIRSDEASGSKEFPTLTSIEPTS